MWALSHVARYQSERGTFAPWLFALARNAGNDPLCTERRRPSCTAWRALTRRGELVCGGGPDKPVEPATLNGAPAGWIEGYGLAWERDGVSYILNGIGLRLDEALRAAGSLSR